MFRVTDFMLVMAVLAAPIALPGLAHSAPSVTSGITTETYAGRARLLDGKPCYTEKHEVTRDSTRVLRSKTLYFNPDGTPRASLESTFPLTPFLPDYRFEDLSRKIQEGVSCCSSDGSLRVSANGQSKSLKFEKDWVSGQGFHYFAQESLERLASGEVRLLQFLIPSRLSPYSFRIRAGEATDLSKGRVEVVLEVQNWILRIFAPKIRALYDLKTRRLLHYFGPSNLLDSKGDVQTVEIDYEY